MKSMGQKYALVALEWRFSNLSYHWGKIHNLWRAARLEQRYGEEIFLECPKAQRYCCMRLFLIQIVDWVRAGNVWVHKSFWQPCWSRIRYLVNGDIHSCWKLQLLTMGKGESVLCQRATTHGNKKILDWLQGNSNSSNDWQWTWRDMIKSCITWFDLTNTEEEWRQKSFQNENLY